MRDSFAVHAHQLMSGCLNWGNFLPGRVVILAAGVFFFADRAGQQQTVAAPEITPPPVAMTAEANAATETTPPMYATSRGSGVIVDADKGYIITNAHVID